jgi:hypothetical protein
MSSKCVIFWFGTLRDAAGRTFAPRSTFNRMPPAVRRLSATLAVVSVLFSPAAASADPVLDWNVIAVTVTNGQGPFVQARLLAITQLAVFEAVNAVTGEYEPYLGTVVAPVGASADAAAIAAAHKALRNYLSAVPGVAATLDAALASSLAAIPNGPAKSGGIATGEAAADAMITARLNDGSAPPQFHVPGAVEPGRWQLTPGCSAGAGVFLHWRNMTPFGISSVERFISDPPPALTSRKYTKDYLELKAVGSLNSTERTQDRSDVARFYAAASPGFVFNTAARQVAVAQRRSLSHNARALALINMAINDSLIASFATKYQYDFWRPETAIRAGDSDGNPKTDPDTTFTPFIPTPCFPSYSSNHASGSYGGAEVLKRVYGAGRHSITLTTTVVVAGSPMPLTLRYTRLQQITADIDDARVYGGIHFRFDQEAGARLGGDVGGTVYRRNLRRDHHRDHDREGDCDEHDNH